MKLRRYQSSDCAELSWLFYHTVHTVNRKDYEPYQLDAWATATVDLEAWDRSFLQHHTLVVEKDRGLIGFGDMDRMGYLDRIYVHRDYQRMGVASMILDELERLTLNRNTEIKKFVTYGSITARPFLEKKGYAVIHQNTVVRKGVTLNNFFMEKLISANKEG